MKFYVKYLPGFCVTYLHNPFECAKCLDMMDSDDFEENFYKFYPEKKKDQQNPSKKGVPLKNFVPKTETVTPESDFLTQLPTSSAPLISKRRRFNGVNLESYGQCSRPLKKINKVKTSSKSSKKICTVKHEKTNAVKKQSSKSVQKLSGEKLPGKGTLKRKRWFVQQLEEKNDNYEDDLFEDKKFGHFQNLLEDESDSPENYTGLKTPVFPFSLSPRERTPSPDYTDCYSAEQLSLSRKRGEEYQYRLNKRKKLEFRVEKEEPETPRVVHEEKPSVILERLLQVQKMLNSQREEQEKSDSEEDQYFSDIL